MKALRDFISASLSARPAGPRRREPKTTRACSSALDAGGIGTGGEFSLGGVGDADVVFGLRVVVEDGEGFSSFAFLPRVDFGLSGSMSGDSGVVDDGGGSSTFFSEY